MEGHRCGKREREALCWVALTICCFCVPALGKNGVNARTFLEKRYKEQDDIEVRSRLFRQKVTHRSLFVRQDAIQLAILTLKEGFDG